MKDNLKKKSNQKGITLITLVVTIVVLSIVSGITISAVSKDDGTIQKSKDAKKEVNNVMENAENGIDGIQEELSEFMDGQGKDTSGSVRLTSDQIADLTEEKSAYTKPYLPSSDFSVSTKEGEKTLADGLVIKDGQGNEYVWVEVPTNIYDNSSYNTKTTSEDMKPLSATDYAKIRYCLTKYAENYKLEGCEDYWYCYNSKWTTQTKSADPLEEVAKGTMPTNLTSGSGNITAEDLTLNSISGTTKTLGVLTYNEYVSKYKKMLSSVYTNGGFYIARYEAGMTSNPADGTKGWRTDISQTIEGLTILSKPDSYPINYVTIEQAEQLAENINSGNKISSLLFGIQWDLTLKYLETKGVIQTELKTNSTSWGNYNNSTYIFTSNSNAKYSIDSGELYNPITNKTTNGSWLLTTGAQLNGGGTTTTLQKQNIYDLAGNVWEITLERTNISSNPCAIRGGWYENLGSVYAAWFPRLY